MNGSAADPHSDHSNSSAWSRTYLAIEFAALFLGGPLLLYDVRRALANYIVPIILVVAAGCFAYLLASDQFDRAQFWRTTQFRDNLRRMLVNFVVGAGVITAVVFVGFRELLFSFPQTYPSTWVLLLLSYPILSVYPQEIIFRAFLFHRYRMLFRSRHSRIGASGIAFAMAHLIFANWVAPLITFAGGLLFARTYSQTESVLQASIEHGLWGNFAFTVGLGWYLYGAHII